MVGINIFEDKLTFVRCLNSNDSFPSAELEHYNLTIGADATVILQRSIEISVLFCRMSNRSVVLMNIPPRKSSPALRQQEVIQRLISFSFISIKIEGGFLYFSLQLRGEKQ